MPDETKPEETGVQITHTVSADEIIAPLGERMPPLTEGQTKEAAQPEQLKSEKIFDARGVEFNPAEHMADENGNPKKNFKGNFYSNKQGRGDKGKKIDTPSDVPKSPDRAPPSFNVPGGSSPTVDPNLGKEPTPDEFDMMAEVYLQSAYGPLMLTFSEAMRPDNEQHKALKQSLAAWLRHKKATELSPGWGFAVTAAAVFVAKTAEPTVKERLAMWSIRIKSWFKKEK
jgi:hypothetical protein